MFIKMLQHLKINVCVFCIFFQFTIFKNCSLKLSKIFLDYSNEKSKVMPHSENTTKFKIEKIILTNLGCW